MFLVQVNINPTLTVLGVVHNTDLASYYPYGLTKVIGRCDFYSLVLSNWVTVHKITDLERSTWYLMSLNHGLI